MIKNLFLDLDDTLFDFHKEEKIALSRTFLHFGVEPTEEVLARYSEINKSQWQLLEIGALTRAEVLTRRFTLLFSEYGLSLDEKEVSDYYAHSLSLGYSFIEGAKELLDYLYGRYRLYITSNGTTFVQMGRIKNSGIGKYFNGIFTSQEIGYEKPDAQFFYFCFSKIPDFKKEETLILGDSLTSDIKGGKNAGILTVWFNPHGKSASEKPDYEVRSLKEFSELLEALNAENN